VSDDIDEGPALREVDILIAEAGVKSATTIESEKRWREHAEHLLDDERDEHYRELAKNYGESPPTDDEFRLLDELDVFATKMKQGITFLAERGHGPRLIRWAIQRHVDTLETGEFRDRVLPLVDLVACDADERLGKARRKELKQALVAAGATSASRDIRKFLDDARNEKAATSLDHPDDLYELETIRDRADCESDHETHEEFDKRVAEVTKRELHDSRSFVHLSGLGLYQSDEDEDVPCDDNTGQVARSPQFALRARRRRLAVRRHFGRSRKRPA
jgi:hypothetical protein